MSKPESTPTASQGIHHPWTNSRFQCSNAHHPYSKVELPVGHEGLSSAPTLMRNLTFFNELCAIGDYYAVRTYRST